MRLVKPRAEAEPTGLGRLLLALLVLAHLQVLGLAESAALPLRLQDVLRHPVLGRLIRPRASRPSARSVRVGRAGGPGALCVDRGRRAALFRGRSGPARPAQATGEVALLALIIVTALVLPTGQAHPLAPGSGPASYTHDGGVIQTEATIRFLLEGRNPYVEDYTETPMAEWGFSEYRTALLPLSVSALDLPLQRRSTWRATRSASTTSA
ncbi:MAG: hypothetical protein R3A10_21460 [Caldilineaceae bacterium]